MVKKDTTYSPLVYFLKYINIVLNVSTTPLYHRVLLKKKQMILN